MTGGGDAGRGRVLSPPARDADVVWHDTECGAYAADLLLWEEIADEADGSILDLGCGTGRVGLHLASRGHEVIGLDVDAKLVAAFNERADGLCAHAVVGDARGFALQREFGLVLGPMQLVQLLADARERIECLRCVAGHLKPGGRAALAIVEGAPNLASGAASEAYDLEAPVPDVREAGGWVYSSLPLGAVVGDGEIAVRRLRQTVAPGGEASEEVSEALLSVLSTDALEEDAVEAGLRPAGRREILPTDAHVGSTVVLLERGA